MPSAHNNNNNNAITIGLSTLVPGRAIPGHSPGQPLKKTEIHATSDDVSGVSLSRLACKLMTDSVTRMLFPRRVGSNFAEYRDGNGLEYSEALRRLSWPVPTDVPAIGQKSATTQLPTLREVHKLTDGKIYTHPTEYIKLRHTDHLSYSKSQSDLGLGSLANPRSAVFDRLYLGSKSQARPGRRTATSKYELAADVAFKNASAVDAVPLYTEAIVRSGEVTPNLFAYEKRCCANAELGRYREALEDATYILEHCDTSERGAALMRVKAIKDFMKRMNSFDSGYHHATSTLVCLLRPREHRQLVQSSPSTYGRPHSASAFGNGLTGVQSVGSLLAWDKEYYEMSTEPHHSAVCCPKRTALTRSHCFQQFY